MITTVMATNKKEFREQIDKLNVMQKRVFSPDEVDYLTDCDGFEYLEFKQEDESDEELLQLFSTWLHERPKQQGHVDYYILIYHRKDQRLTPFQLEYMNRHIAECFDTSHGWLYEINNRVRFRLRIRLICCYKKRFQRMTRKDWRVGVDIDEDNE